MTTQITNYEQLMLDMLLSQFDEKFVIEELTKILARQVQEAEDMWFEVATGIRLEDAVGQQLDNIGNYIVGQPRLGLNDADYLASIKLRIQINTSSGQNELLLSTLIAATGASSVILEEIAPATVQITYFGGIFDPDLIQKLDKVKASGVKIIVISVIITPTFTYDGAPTEGYDSGHYTGLQQNG
jgi:hypothetical protein